MYASSGPEALPAPQVDSPFSITFVALSSTSKTSSACCAWLHAKCAASIYALLLESQRHHRIDLRSAKSWQVVREERHRPQQCANTCESQRVGCRDPKQHPRDQPRHSKRKDGACCDPQEGKRHPLLHDECEHIGTTGSQQLGLGSGLPSETSTRDLARKPQGASGETLSSASERHSLST